MIDNQELLKLVIISHILVTFVCREKLDDDDS